MPRIFVTSCWVVLDVVNSPHDVTMILNAVSAGDQGAVNSLLPLVYDELRSLAARRLRTERLGHTLQATALVHETYIRLVDQTRVQWTGRAHFLAVAATLMRRILVNHERDKRRLKRGGHAVRATLSESSLQTPAPSLDLLALDEAMTRLASIDAQQNRIVELRYFGGLSIEEIAQVTGLSVRTIHREWAFAKAWLRGEVSKGDERDT